MYGVAEGVVALHLPNTSMAGIRVAAAVGPPI